MSGDGTIGVSRRRIDGEAKVRGATRYAADLPVPGLLHARPVLASAAHARIVSIDVTAALAVEGVVAVLTAADLPIAEGATGRAADALAREEVVWAGQPVALVVAETEPAALDASELVIVELDALPAVLDVDAAMAPGAPLARVLGEEPSANVDGHAPMRQGDAAAALAGADAVVSATTRTAWIHQGYLEPQTATAWIEPEGDVVVSTATQGIFSTREELAAVFGLPIGSVRVRPTPLGGAFGGKLMIGRAARRRRRARPAPARAPVALAPGGLRRHQPGARAALRARDRRRRRRDAGGDPRAHPVRPRDQRRLRAREHLRDARGRPVSLGGA